MLFAHDVLLVYKNKYYIEVVMNRIMRLEENRIEQEPFYLPVGHEVKLAESAYESGLPLLLKGPTGCGKTRFIQYMAWKLERPLVTVSCHDVCQLPILSDAT